MKNYIDDQIGQQYDREEERLISKYDELYNLLESLPIEREEKENIIEIVQKISYYSERRGLQRGVKEVNTALMNLYWSTSPSLRVEYWQLEHRNKHEQVQL